ncbi:MAG: GAF domain-containing protein [Promethearchaeota archaeon]
MQKVEKEKQYRSILQFIEQKLLQIEDITPEKVYMLVIDHLSSIPYFNWVGIYLLDKEKNELVLDYYVGKLTEHTHIPVGRGVCGSAVVDNEDKIIDDVTDEGNYLACSLETRSEIVVLIENQTGIIGQIDVDSDDVAAFDETDQKYLRKVANLIIENL